MDPELKKYMASMLGKLDSLVENIATLSQNTEKRLTETSQKIERLSNGLTHKVESIQLNIERVTNELQEKIDHLSDDMNKTVADLSAKAARTETARVLGSEIPSGANVGLRVYLENMDHQGYSLGDSATEPGYDPYPEVFNTR